VCAVRSDHPQITDSLSLEQFLNAKHGMYATSGSPHSVVDETLARLQRTRRGASARGITSAQAAIDISILEA